MFASSLFICWLIYRLRVEQETVHALQDQKDQALAFVSHELRQPLATLHLAATMLHRDRSEDSLDSAAGLIKPVGGPAQQSGRGSGGHHAASRRGAENRAAVDAPAGCDAGRGGRMRPDDRPAAADAGSERAARAATVDSGDAARLE